MSAKETYILGKETYYCMSIPEVRAAPQILCALIKMCLIKMWYQNVCVCVCVCMCVCVCVCIDTYRSLLLYGVLTGY